MPPTMNALVDKLRSLYSSGTCTQRGIAKYLGISAPQLSDVFAGRHGLTGNQVFRAQQLLKTMKTQDRTMRPIPDDDEADRGEMSEKEPKTLAEAKELIQVRQRELSYLQQKLATYAGSKPTVVNNDIISIIQPAARPNSSSGTYATPKANASGQPSGIAFDPANPKSWDGFNKSQIEFPSDCNSPAAIGAHLATVSSERLPWYLKGAPKTPTEKLQRKMVAGELQARKETR